MYTVHPDEMVFRISGKTSLDAHCCVFFFSFVDSPKFKTSGTRHRYSYTILSPFTKFVSVHPLPRIHRDICSRSLGSSHGCFVSKGFFPVGAIHPDSLAVSKSCATWSQGRWPRWGCKQCIHTTWYVGISERLYNIYIINNNRDDM